jgi:hypothetical protein
MHDSWLLRNPRSEKLTSGTGKAVVRRTPRTATPASYEFWYVFGSAPPWACCLRSMHFGWRERRNGPILCWGVSYLTGVIAINGKFMNRLAPSAVRGAKTTLPPNLPTRLHDYARRNGLSFIDHPRQYEIAWSHGAARYFIEIDKETAGVRAGATMGANSPVRYRSVPTYLGSAPLEELLDRQRESAEGDQLLR